MENYMISKKSFRMFLITLSLFTFAQLSFAQQSAMSTDTLETAVVIQTYQYVQNGTVLSVEPQEVLAEDQLQQKHSDALLNQIVLFKSVFEKSKFAPLTKLNFSKVIFKLDDYSGIYNHPYFGKEKYLSDIPAQEIAAKGHPTSKLKIEKTKDADGTTKRSITITLRLLPFDKSKENKLDQYFKIEYVNSEEIDKKLTDYLAASQIESALEGFKLGGKKTVDVSQQERDKAIKEMEAARAKAITATATPATGLQDKK